MKDNQKFWDSVIDGNSDYAKELDIRHINRAYLRESQAIALKVLLKLDSLKWTQKILAEKLEVSPQYVNKLVKGKENLSLETQIKLQNILDIPILASYYEHKASKGYQSFFTEITTKEKWGNFDPLVYDKGFSMSRKQSLDDAVMFNQLQENTTYSY